MSAGPPAREQPLLHHHPGAFRLSIALWVVGGSLFVAMAIPSLASLIQHVDDPVNRWAISAEWGPAVAVAKVLDFLGSNWITWPIIVLTALWLLGRRRWTALSFWLVAMVAAQLLIGPVKILYDRARPPMPLVVTSGASFPSGHAVVGAAIAVGLVVVLVPSGPRRINLEMLAAAFAVVMASSRVYLRAHWLSDVAAGASAGAAAVLMAATVVHIVSERRRGPHRTIGPSEELVP